MSFITGALLIDAPSSALNNAGIIKDAQDSNKVAVKYIPYGYGSDYGYPYVSAQAFRYWLRDTLEKTDPKWKFTPPIREESIASVSANPILNWDDDLLGYMLAKAEEESSVSEETDDDNSIRSQEIGEQIKEDKKKKGKKNKKKEGEVFKTLTRASPFKVSTLVSIAPVNLINDFGVMSRQEGYPVIHEHQFYRAILQGLFSLDLDLVGKFYYLQRTGFQNINHPSQEIINEYKLEHIPREKYYRLDRTQRIERIQSLLKAIGRLQGGAKQTLHYTDVSPAAVIMAITPWGNHPFNYLFKQDQDKRLQIQEETLTKAILDTKLSSPLYIGWKPGFAPEAYEKIQNLNIDKVKIIHSTPRMAFEALADWINSTDEWDR